MKNVLYEITGFNAKEKREDVAYVAARSPELALQKVTFLTNPVATGKTFTLSEAWDEFE